MDDVSESKKSDESSRSSYSVRKTESSKDGHLAHTDVENVALEKKVGLMGSIGLVVGVIIGSGIFISPSGVAEGAGSVGLSLVLWAVGGIVTMFAGLSMAELGTTITKSGGEYAYIKMTLCDWLAYLWSWSQCFLLKPAAQAVISITCAEYILVPVFQDGCGAPPTFYTKILSSVVVLLITVMNVWSVRLASSVQIVFTIAKILALCIIIVGGIVNMANGKLEYLQSGFEGTNTNPGQIMLGLYSAMFAYDGWSNLNAVTEEVINPARNLPLAMYIGIPLIVVLYMLTNISYFTVMDVEGLLNSDAVAMTWANEVIPTVSWIIPLSVAMSTFGGVNGGFFAVGRLYYTAAKENHQPKIFSYIQVKRLTPLPAMIINAFFTILYSLLGPVTALIDFLSFAIWMFYAVTMFVLMYMRFKAPYKHLKRPYKVPFVFPLIVFIFSVAMVIIPIATAPQLEFLYATVVMLAGFIFYFPFVYCKVNPGCMKSVTTFCQLLMEVVPPADEYEDDHEIKSTKTD